KPGRRVKADDPHEIENLAGERQSGNETVPVFFGSAYIGNEYRVMPTGDRGAFRAFKSRPRSPGLPPFAFRFVGEAAGESACADRQGENRQEFSDRHSFAFSNKQGAAGAPDGIQTIGISGPTATPPQYRLRLFLAAASGAREKAAMHSEPTS